MEGAIMDTTLTDAPSFSGSPSAMPPRGRLPGEGDPADAETLGAPTAAERLAPKAVRWSRKGLLMSTVGVAFLIGSIGVVGYMQRARLERIPAVREALAKLPVAWTHAAGAAVVGNAV